MNQMNQSIFKERRSVRATTGGQRVFITRTFTGRPTQSDYDAFLDSRSGLECEWNQRKDSPLVEIDGSPRWASYSFNTHEVPA